MKKVRFEQDLHISQAQQEAQEKANMPIFYRVPTPEFVYSFNLDKQEEDKLIDRMKKMHVTTTVSSESMKEKKLSHGANKLAKYAYGASSD